MFSKAQIPGYSQGALGAGCFSGRLEPPPPDGGRFEGHPWVGTVFRGQCFDIPLPHLPGNEGMDSCRNTISGVFTVLLFDVCFEPPIGELKQTSKKAAHKFLRELWDARLLGRMQRHLQKG